MDKPELSTLRIDDEFLRLSSCETNELMDLLEHEITTLNQIPTIYVWRGYIVDGHKRYALCHQCNVPFFTRILHFKSKFEVLIWRCSQLISEKTCHTSKFFHYYIGKYYLLEQLRVGEGKRIRHNQYTPKENLLSENEIPSYMEIANKIATEAGITFSSVLKYSREYKYIEAIYETSPHVAKLILEERFLVSYDSLNDLSKLTTYEMNRAERYLQTLPHGYVNIDKLHEHIGKRCMHYDNPCHTTKPKKQKKPQVEIKPQIKITPKYDPDAEVSSLSLTIPSWVSQINRTKDNANLGAISDTARDKLRNELAKMIYSIRLLLNEMEETNNE